MRHYSRMNAMWLFVVLRLLLFGVLTKGLSANVSARPKAVNVGAIFAYNSTIGRVARIAIEEAVKDVNLNSSVLQGTELLVNMHSSNCSGFVGMVGALQFMESETIAVIGPQTSVVAHTISHVANEFHVPLVSFAATDPTLTSLQFPYFVRATTSDLHQMTAISEIIEFYAWRDVIVIFLDDDYGRNGVAALTDALSAKRCKISYKAGIPPAPGVNRTDIMDILIKVALLEPRVIVLHAYPRIGFMVFDVARYLGMVGDGYAWIATDWLSSVLDTSFPLPSETMDSLQGILTLRQHTPDSERNGAFSSRWNKITGGSLGLNSFAFYAYDTVWLLAHAIDSFLNQGGNITFSNDSRLQTVSGSHMHFEAMSIFDGGPHLLKNILETNFVGLTGQVKFDPDRSLVFPAYDIINVVGTGVRRIGYWSNYSGLSTLTPESLRSKPPNRSSVNQRLYSVVWPGETVTKPRGWVFPSNGRLLKIAVPKRVSYTEFLSQVPGTNVFKGYCVDVFIAAVSLLPYAVPYQFIPFGNGHENPSYSELVRLITTGDFDGAVGDIAIVTNRTRIVDFSQPYVSSGLVVVAPFIKHHTGAWAFLRPFSRSLWGVTAAFFLFVGFVVWTLEHRNNDQFRGPPKKQLITMIWFSLSTMFFSHRENTVSTLGRMVLLIWLFVVLIITSSYTASLTSILTVQQLYSPIRGIDSLKETKDPIGFQVGSFAENYLVEEIGIDRSRLVPLGSPEAYARALERGPKNGGVAAVVDELPYIELFLSRECRFRIIGQEFTRSGWGFAFPRDSPLAVDLSTAIMALSENGDLQRIHDKWLTRSACSSDNTEIDSERLHLTSFVGLYLLCGIACFIALLIYFFQIIPECKHAVREESVSSQEGGNLRSKRLKTLLSVMDEKVDPSSSGGCSRKKRKTERAHSTGNIRIKFSNS